MVRYTGVKEEMTTDDGREREVGKLGKTGMIVWVFSGIFALLFIFGSTHPMTFYVGVIFLGINWSVVAIYIMWTIAGKVDGLVTKHL